MKLDRAVAIFVAFATFALLAVPPAGATVTITEFATPSTTEYIALGPDGNLWFTEDDSQIVRITASGVITGEFPVSGPYGPASLRDITAGSCGAPFLRGGCLWFTDWWNGAIGRITTSGAVTEFPTCGNCTGDNGITVGPDDNLWFTFNDQIGRITTSGVTTLFSGPAQLCDLNEITAGRNGNLWFTEDCQNDGKSEIGEMDTSGNIIGEFRLPDFTDPFGITAGPDGNLWFTERGSDQIGEMDTSGNLLAEYPIPTDVSGPWDIAPGPCGTGLWFTESNGNKVGQITTSGVITDYPTTADSFPVGITPGPDNNVWFTEDGASQIGRANPGLLAHFLCVTLLPGTFVANLAKGQQGDAAGWLMQWPGTHGIMDASGMGLFGSQDAVSYGEAYSFTFIGAGTYPYEDPFHSSTRGKVTIPISVRKVAGTTNTAQVTWASAEPPLGYVFDVQVKQLGSSSFLDWRVGVSGPTAAFGPGDPLYVGAGKYTFRARMRNTSNGAASGYSPARSITLT